MSLLEKINQDANDALKNSEADKLSTLRLLKNSLDGAAKTKQAELNDEEVIKVLQKEAKQRRDSIESYKQGDRQDLADKEAEELKLIDTYLPTQMSEDELGTIIDGAIAETGASSMADMGKVMGALSKQTAGKADGSQVAQLVKQKLASS